MTLKAVVLRPTVWPWPLIMWLKNQLGTSCTKFGKLQAKGLKDFEQITSNLTLTFDYVTRNSVGNIYSLRLYEVCQLSREGAKMYLADITWSSNRSTDRHVQNNMPPFSKGGGGLNYKFFSSSITLTSSFLWLLHPKKNISHSPTPSSFNWTFFP